MKTHWKAIIVTIFCMATSNTPGLAGESTQPLDTLAKLLPTQLSASKKLILGPRGKSKSTVIPTVAKRGMVTKFNHGTTNACIIRMSSANGGIGLQYVELTLGRAVKSPAQEYAWQQGAFKTWLEAKHKESQAGLAEAKEAASLADALATVISGWDAIPDSLKLPKPLKGESWPAVCFNQTVQALKKKDLPAATRWSQELRGATFAVADLQRWTDFLLGNTLRGLAFQAYAKGCFDEMEGQYGGKYNALTHVGRFPAGEFSLYSGDNFLEVERQAEGLFWPPKSWLDTPADAIAATPAAAYIAPTERPLFLKAAEALNEKSRDIWFEAAKTPFERSFITNMLWRARKAEFTEDVIACMKRYDDTYGKKPTLSGLMDVLPYRAGAAFAGLEWPDRYDPELVKASALVTKGDEAGLKLAHKEANKGYTTYTGLVLTLRAARKSGKADCIRATDLIAAIFRNAGQPGFRSVRMSRGAGIGKVSGMGHTIAGITTGDLGAKEAVITYDGLTKKGNRTSFPKGYIGGTTFSTEIYGRGLDGWVWMAGVVGKGDNKGKYMTAAVPYLPDAPEEEIDTVLGK